MQMRRCIVWVCCVCASFLAACQMLTGFTPMVRFSPASLGESVVLQQHLQVNHVDKIREIDVILEVDNQHISLVGLGMGQRLLSLNYDGQQLLSWSDPHISNLVEPESVLANLQLAYWPEQVLQTQLPEGFTVKQTGLSRSILCKGKRIIEITYTNTKRIIGKIIIRDLRYGYTITVESVAIDD